MRLKLSVLPTECDCIICSSMCHTPCCGTPEDMEKLIAAGYADRLMLDDWPEGPTMLKPALKGFCGEKAPYDTHSREGCTFWKKGKCELHAQKLKPSQGRLAHHALTDAEKGEIVHFIKSAWAHVKGDPVIQLWKQTINQRQK